MKWILLAIVGLVAMVGLTAIIGMLLPQGHLATRKAALRRPPEQVWEAITGPADWVPGLRGFENLPAVNGRRRWRQVLERGNQSVTFEEVAATPPSRLEVRIADRNLPFGGGWTYEISPTPEGSMLRVTERGEVYNPIFRFMSRFIFGHTASLENYLRALGKKFGEDVRIEE